MNNNIITSFFTRLNSKVPLGLVVAVLSMLAVLWSPEQPGLSAAGHAMLAILVFAVIVWMTEAVTYEVSALMIVTLIPCLLYSLPLPDAPHKIYNTMSAMKLALSGFANPALGLIVGALFIAATMSHTGLDRRIAFFTLSKIGTSTQRILVGIVIMTIFLSLLVPSATARGACMVSIMMGIITAFNLPLRSNIAAALMITVAQAINIWNVGIQTAAVQNILSLSFMQETLAQRVTWLEWFISGGPWAVIMSVVLIWVVKRFLPMESDYLPKNKEVMVKALSELGPMTYAQKYLVMVSTLLLLGWATEGKLHQFDTTTVTYIGLVALMLPQLGIISWKEIQPRIPGGVIVVFGVGISLGLALLETKAAEWLGNQVGYYIPFKELDIVATFAILSAFLIIIHLGFASATASCSAVLPVLIKVIKPLSELGDFSALGVTMALSFAISFGFILPINAPQNIVCLATNTFNTRQFIKIGLVLTLVGYGLMITMAGTYWKWLGWF